MASDLLAGTIPSRAGITAMLSFARAGYRVVVLGDTLADADATLDAVAAFAPDGRVRRVSGRRRVEFEGGGLLRAESALALDALRGISVDMICTPGWLALRHRARLLPSLAGSTRLGAGIYVYSHGTTLLPEREAIVSDVVQYLDVSLGIKVQPWQRRLIEQLVGDGPQADARPSQDP